MARLACIVMALPFAAAVQSRSAANPIRKVVDMLQSMQKKVQEEGEKEKDLYEKFMCYCKNGGSDLTSSIAAAKDKLGSLASDIENAEAKHAAATAALKKAQDDRAAGQKGMDEATALREKEAGIYAQFKADSNANLAALTKAITAISTGMAGGFLQTNSANILRKILAQNHHLDDD